MFFRGFRRKDGQVGIRNHVLVISSVACVNPVTEQIAKMTGAIPITHGYGCGQAEEDSAETAFSLSRYAENPNVAAAFIVGMGCEQIDAERLTNGIQGKPTDFVNVSEAGTSKSIGIGIQKVREMLLYSAELEREDIPLTKLVLHVLCGGSDTTSGIASNPALGVASDLLISEGGTVLLDTAAFGEHYLLKNVTDRKVIERLWQATDSSAEEVRKLPTVRGINPTPGNMKQGLTTLTEKRLGGAMKGGTTPLRGVLTYKEKPPGPGLYYSMPGDYIGYTDIVDGTMKLLQGSQINCFTTGTGTPIGLAIAPVIKITANPATYERNRENMDIDASTILTGEETIAEVGRRIFNELIAVANGKLTKSEIMGHRDFFLPVFYQRKGA